MRVWNLGKASVLLASALSLGSPASGGECHHVAGKVVQTPLATYGAPMDPFGRGLSTATGTINGVGSTIVTSVAMGPDGPASGNWNAICRDLYVVNPQDQLVFDGMTAVSAIPGNYTDANSTTVLAVNGAMSLGRFAGATGTVTLTGVAYDFYGQSFPFPGAAPGASYFVGQYEGEICLTNAR